MVQVTSKYPLVHFAEFHINTKQNQLKMIDLANENIGKAMKIEGLISATFHQSIDDEYARRSDDDDDNDNDDGSYRYSVINYGQWLNVEAIENLKKQPGFGGGSSTTGSGSTSEEDAHSSNKPYWDGIAINEHHLYELVSSHTCVRSK